MSKNKLSTKLRYVTATLGLLIGWSGLGGVGGIGNIANAADKKSAGGCSDVVGIFVRGSGEERWTGVNYQDFKRTLAEKLATTSLSYDFIDLDYPAVAIDFWVAVGAFFSGGNAYTFGNSVKRGIDELVSTINSGCENTKYVIGGYSQGAMVLTQALPLLKSERVLYAATFGDPKLYLPEGAGFVPAACYNEGLSNYRAYVPDCTAHNGKLGGINPYQPAEYIDKLGTWCNRHDFMCSPYLDMDSHTSYVADNLYEDASRKIYEKIADHFHIENNFRVPHDTVILIDSTGSMSEMIDEFKNEALRLAEEVLESGGRVALYDYGDLDDPYFPVRHCDFEHCDLDTFRDELENITPNGGGDTPESLLSASFYAMSELNWKMGHNKSLVVLTDATYHFPDRDGITFSDVVKLSKIIDPVNFYIITTSDLVDSYQELADATDGKVVTISDNLSLLTDEIIARTDSLPRVEELDVFGTTLPVAPELRILEIEDNDTEVKIHFQSTGVRTLVTLNDALLGMTDGDTVTIGELDRGMQNRIILTPLSSEVNGESREVILEEILPLVPNTGRPQ